MTESRRRYGRTIWGVGFVVMALIMLGSAVASADARKVDPWHGRATIQRMDVTLDSLGRGGDRRAARHLYERGWWSLQATPDGVVMIHRR